MFIDEAKIEVKAGNGGNGCVSFRREKYVPKGGPDGGDGGKGGDIVLRVDRNMSTLLDFTYRPRYRAKNGGHGKGKKMTGENGAELVLPVPRGTLVIDGETGLLLADLTRSDQRFVLARGGNGGFGNARFATPVRRAPRKATKGWPGEEKTVLLHLKLIADVGLVGKPNAGKSTLLSRVSKARPKIADYPFTTKEPHLGVVRGKGMDFVVADIPGLIEGAHLGRGMGTRFLKHIERTKILLVLVESTAPSVEADYGSLVAELGSYSVDLLERPRCLVLTKADLLTDRSAQVAQAGPGIDDVFAVRLVSAVTGEGIDELFDTVEGKLREMRAGDGHEGT
jgi:GTP-binding protein